MNKKHNLEQTNYVHMTEGKQTSKTNQVLDGFVKICLTGVNFYFPFNG